MRRIALQASALASIGFVWFLFGIAEIFIGSNTGFSNILGGCALMTIGMVTWAFGFERLVNYQLGEIHDRLGPYKTRDLTLLDIRGCILLLLALCAYTGGTTLSAFVFFRHWPVEYFDLGIALLPLGLALWSLSRMHADIFKYNDIANAIDDIVNAINITHEDVSLIERTIEKRQTLDKKIGQKNGEHDRTYYAFDFIPHGEIPPGLECGLPSPVFP